MRDKIFRYFENNMTNIERKDFLRMLSVSEHDRKSFIEIKNFLTKRNILSASDDKEEIQNALNEIHNMLGVKSQDSSFNLKIRYILYPFAAIILLFVSGLLISKFYWDKKENESIEYLANIETPDKANGVDILFSNGTVAKVGGNSDSGDIVNSDIVVNASGNVINIKNIDNVDNVDNSQSANADNNALNYITNNSKEDFLLELPDGTKIWMRYKSHIGFPNKFKGEARIIEFSGEGYFDVASNRESPFIIESNGKTAKVLGTEFNFKSDVEESLFEISMTSGKLVVTDSLNSNIVLTKDMQLIMNTDDNTYSIKEIDSYRYRAWRDGYFVFMHDDLKDVLNTLSDWYDIEILIETDKYDDDFFNGKFRRGVRLDEIITMLQKSYGFHFYMKDNILHIK